MNLKGFVETRAFNFLFLEVMYLYLTLKELEYQLKEAIKDFNLNTEEELVTDAWIAGKYDRSYPEGTVMIQCRTAGAKVVTNEDVHVLSLQSHKTGVLQ